MSAQTRNESTEELEQLRLEVATHKARADRAEKERDALLRRQAETEENR